ncbi:phage holin, lambda family [Pseudomonas mendocina]|nr:phage holin, lambda family [Pseudomonas mendocina]MDV5862008.1 phage holin, lambda family [Pseudomonas mendocina]
MTKMPDKDPSFWAIVLLALREHGLAVALAFVLSYVRILYDDKEPKPVRQLLEASLGALIVFLVGLAAEKFGMSSGWSYAVAGFVGVLGVNQVRTLAQKWASRKVEG